MGFYPAFSNILVVAGILGVFSTYFQGSYVPPGYSYWGEGGSYEN